MVWDAWLGGQPLIARAKELVPRCLTPTERRSAFLVSTVPPWCAALAKWPYAPAKAAMIEGMRLLDKEEDLDALMLLGHAVALEPALRKEVAEVQAKTYFKRGQLQLQQGKEEPAKALFDRAIKHDVGVEPQVREAMNAASFFAGVRELKQGNDAVAATLFAAALDKDAAIKSRIDEEMATEHFNRGLRHVNAGKYADAEASFQVVQQHDGKYERRIREAWASHHFERGRRALGEPNGERIANAAFAEALRYDKSYDKRITDARRSLEEEHAKKEVAQGRRLLTAKKYDEANAEFARARARDGSPEAKAELHNGIAWGQFVHDRSAEGLDDAEKSVALRADDRSALDTRGQIYLALKRYDEAFADFDKAIRLGQTYSATFYGRARVHEFRGNKDAAIADYRSTISGRQDDDFARKVDAEARDRLKALGVAVDPAPASTVAK